MARAILLLIQGKSKQLTALARISVAGPVLIIAWYELGGLFVERFSVAVVAWLLITVYSAVLTLVTARLGAGVIDGEADLPDRLRGLKRREDGNGAYAASRKHTTAAHHRAAPTLQSFALNRSGDPAAIDDGEDLGSASHIGLPLRG